MAAGSAVSTKPFTPLPRRVRRRATETWPRAIDAFRGEVRRERTSPCISTCFE